MNDDKQPEETKSNLLAQFTPEQIAEAEAEMFARARAFREAEGKPADNLEEVNSRPITAADEAYAENIAREAALQNSLEAIEATDTHACTSASDVGQVIAKYVKLMMRKDKRGVRLYELNRRFGVDAKRFKTTVRQIGQDLVQNKVLEYRVHRGLAIYLDPIILLHELRDKTFNEREAIKDSFVEKAFFKKKK